VGYSRKAVILNKDTFSTIHSFGWNGVLLNNYFGCVIWIHLARIYFVIVWVLSCMLCFMTCTASSKWQEELCFRVFRHDGRPVSPVVHRLTPLSHDPTSLYLVEIFEWNWSQIFVMWVGTAEKIFKVRGERSRSYWDQMHFYGRGIHFVRWCDVDEQTGENIARTLVTN